MMQDPVARRRRRRQLIRRVTRMVVRLVLILGPIAGFLWFSPATVEEIAISGASADVATDIRAVLDEALGQRWLGAVPTGRNMLLVSQTSLQAAILDRVPIVRAASVTRNWPDTIQVAIEVREPRGIWCRRTDGEGVPEQCAFWDASGARWGDTTPSVGPLLLQIRDERTEEGDEPRILSGVLSAVNGIVPLGLRARLVTLPDAEPGGMRIELMRGFELRMDAVGDVPDQLATLEVFLGDKAKDPGFHPAYIDLRTPGRVYYK